jgi:hypothetical protein
VTEGHQTTATLRRQNSPTGAAGNLAEVEAEALAWVQTRLRSARQRLESAVATVAAMPAGAPPQLVSADDAVSILDRPSNAGRSGPVGRRTSPAGWVSSWVDPPILRTSPTHPLEVHRERRSYFSLFAFAVVFATSRRVETGSDTGSLHGRQLRCAPTPSGYGSSVANLLPMARLLLLTSSSFPTTALLT